MEKCEIDELFKMIQKRNLEYIWNAAGMIGKYTEQSIEEKNKTLNFSQDA